MGSMLIRNLDDELKARLRMRAAANRRSMEEEVRLILRKELKGEEEVNIVDLARELFGPEYGVDLEPHPGVFAREPPDFGQDD